MRDHPPLLAACGHCLWGNTAPVLPTPANLPIIGLLAAALGIRRKSSDKKLWPTPALLLCVLMPWESGHETTTPLRSPSKTGRYHYTRRSELAVDDLNTILSNRDYRCDAAYTVAISSA